LGFQGVNSTVVFCLFLCTYQVIKRNDTCSNLAGRTRENAWLTKGGGQLCWHPSAAAVVEILKRPRHQAQHAVPLMKQEGTLDMKEKKSPGRHDATSLHHRRSPCVLCISASRCSMSGGATESSLWPLFARPLACLARYPLLRLSLSVSGFVPVLPDRDRTIWNIFWGKLSAMLKCHPFNSVLCLLFVWSGSWDMDLLSLNQSTVQSQYQNMFTWYG